MNYLASSSSPYLLQHAKNPVHWYPWSEAAFRRARVEEKPIFLSIGYSTCHWCHVMAHESFENQKIAALLNEHFICIKVDREERPDVDRLYMAYVQALTGSGGWPMSVWLTPELKPFFGGTYFPPENLHGRVGFPSVLLQLAKLWRNNRSRLEQEALRAIGALKKITEKKEASFFEAKDFPMEHAYQELSRSFDPTWGGFGSAPKFPRVSNLFFLFRYYYKNKHVVQARAMVLLTLEKMAAGGMHDHLGGGFHRYSVDATWQVPHFEKMLYDQAQLAMVYLEAWQITGIKKYADIVRSTLNYVQRDMSASGGGFYSAEDADSAVACDLISEGAFYVWSFEEIQNLLSSQEASLVSAYYGVRPEGNVSEEHDPYKEFAGKNILMSRHDFFPVAKELGINEKTAEEILAHAREKLLLARNQRLRPHCDDKILTAWNGLMISAFARAGASFNSLEDIEIAKRAAFFLREHLYDEATGELRRSCRAGKSTGEAFAEDYAFLIQGLLDLYEATGEISWLQWADLLQKKMNELFWDNAEGGYFSSVASDPHLLLRIKEDYDGAEPSANSIAALNLLRFSRMLNDEAAARQAEQIFKITASTLEEMPTAVPQLLVALQFSLMPSRQCVVAGELAQADTMQREVRKGFHPEEVLLFADGGDAQAWLASRNTAIAAMKPIDGKATLYRCENFCCQAPCFAG
ncbi:MAG: thioredoxin domain-containing protein [Chthoniobacterales bacterium]